MSPPASHTASISIGSGTRDATTPGDRKMPEPIVMPTTSPIVCQKPSRLANVGWPVACVEAGALIEQIAYARSTKWPPSGGPKLQWDHVSTASSFTGTTIQQYRIGRRLGAGGMGEVYIADDTRLGRQVALKFLRADRQRDAESRTRLIREARAASLL